MSVILRRFCSILSDRSERDYSDGASFPQFLKNFRQDFIDTLTPDDQAALASLLPKETTAESAAASSRKFVKDWTMQDLQPHLDEAKSGRSYNTGKAAFTQAQCMLQYHRMGNTGGSVGPELAGSIEPD